MCCSLVFQDIDFDMEFSIWDVFLWVFLGLIFVELRGIGQREKLSWNVGQIIMVDFIGDFGIKMFYQGCFVMGQ